MQRSKRRKIKRLNGRSPQCANTIRIYPWLSEVEASARQLPRTINEAYAKIRHSLRMK